MHCIDQQMGSEEEGDSQVSDHDVSWVTTKKRKKCSSAQITLQNRFDALSDKNNGDQQSDNNEPVPIDTDNEPVIRPPDFYVDGVENIEGMIKKFTQLTGENSFTYKCLHGGSVKIVSKTIAVYRSLTHFLKDKDISFYTFQLKSERSFNVVINGLHKTYKVNDLVFFLKQQGHNVRSASVMQKRIYDPNSETYKTIFFDKFIVHLDPAENNKLIYNIGSIDHCIVSVEPPHKRSNGPVQCTNCQSRGHSRNYCYRSPKCVKCAGMHHTNNCTKPQSEKPKCANCGEAHTANYRGCIDYKRNIRPSRSDYQTRPPAQEFNIQDHRFESLPQGRGLPQEQPQVRRDFSYADVTRQDTFMMKIEQLMEKQIEMTNTLMNMMSTIINHICRK